MVKRALLERGQPDPVNAALRGSGQAIGGRVKRVGKTIAITVLVGVMSGMGLAPVAAAPVAESRVVESGVTVADEAHPGYETNGLDENGKALAAYRSFWVTSTKGKRLYVKAGSDLHYGRAGSSKAVSFLAVNGIIHMVKASVNELDKKTVSVPMGRAEVRRATKVYALGHLGKVAGRAKEGEMLTIFSLVLNGRTLVEFRGERGWVKTGDLKAKTASVRKAASDAKLYFPHDGVMKKVALRLREDSTFFVQGEVEARIKGSRGSARFVRTDIGWIKRSDSVLIESRRAGLTSSVTRLG